MPVLNRELRLNDPMCIPEASTEGGRSSCGAGLRSGMALMLLVGVASVDEKDRATGGTRDGADDDDGNGNASAG